jgi:beta-mannosidase
VDVVNLLALQTIDADLDLTMSLEGQVVARIRCDDLLLRSGINHINMTIEVENPQLWWPNGMGAQPLYEVQVSATSEGYTDTLPVTHYGIRTIDLDLARLDPGNRRFQIRVNGQPVICKGGDWIPADAIYARVSPEKYDRLIREAHDANFNMLRIWGGGIYETDAFYAACDQYGILIWHDFMFACSTYPDHLDWFRQEATREMDYQTRRLRNHASLALWCGNNENQWIFSDQMRWGIDIADSQTFGLYLYNQLAPEIVQQNCPEIPYWNSSPYGGEEPNACSVGDRHHWHDCMMNPAMEKRITPELYDGIGSKFVSEYGYPGPCVRESIEEYLDGQPIDRDSKVWDMHNNTFEKHTVLAGIRKHYTDQTLDFDDYILYASLVQGLMLGYSLEALRATPECNGALFWMYNDCWGEVGWTIIDYYLRRKPSYYMVKRAFAPVRLILRQKDQMVQIIGCNDTAEQQTIPVEAGWFSLDGSAAQTNRLVLELKPFSRSVVETLILPAGDTERSIFAVKPVQQNLDIMPALLRQTEHRNLKLVEQPLTLANVQSENDDLLLTVSSPVFAHAVHIQSIDLPCSDNYFDLLPGESRTIRVIGGAALDPSLVKVIAVVP